MANEVRIDHFVNVALTVRPDTTPEASTADRSAVTIQFSRDLRFRTNITNILPQLLPDPDGKRHANCARLMSLIVVCLTDIAAVNGDQNAYLLSLFLARQRGSSVCFDIVGFDSGCYEWSWPPPVCRATLPAGEYVARSWIQRPNSKFPLFLDTVTFEVVP